MSQLRLALVGKAGAGKDHVVEVLRRHGLPVMRTAYADALKVTFGHALMVACGLVDEGYRPYDEVLAWVNEHKHLSAVRMLLQGGGEAPIQITGDEELWIKRWRWNYRPYFGAPSVGIMVITDMRKLPEAEHARRDGFTIVRITRTDGYEHPSMTDEARAHRSEVEQDRIVADHEITNDGTPDFDRQILALMERLRSEHDA